MASPTRSRNKYFSWLRAFSFWSFVVAVSQNPSEISLIPNVTESRSPSARAAGRRRHHLRLEPRGTGAADRWCAVDTDPERITRSGQPGHHYGSQVDRRQTQEGVDSSSTSHAASRNHGAEPRSGSERAADRRKSGPLARAAIDASRSGWPDRPRPKKLWCLDGSLDAATSTHAPAAASARHVDGRSGEAVSGIEKESAQVATEMILKPGPR